MKKLNQTELGILTRRIKNDLAEKAKIVQEELDAKSDKENLKAAQATLRQIQKINEQIAKLGELAQKILRSQVSEKFFENINIDTVLHSMRPTQTKVRTFGYGGSREIFDALVLSQIECEDLNELIRSVTGQFITK